MKASWMHRDRDFDVRQEVPWNAAELTQDLELATLLRAMAGGDDVVLKVSRAALLTGLRNDVDTILYRQGVLQDCLRNPTFVRSLYDLAGEAIETRRKEWLGVFSHTPTGILAEAIDLMQMYIGMLRRLRGIVESSSAGFESEGLSAFSATIERDLSDDQLASMQQRLTEARFEHGVLLSGRLDEGNQGVDYVVRQARHDGPGWLRPLLGKGPSGYTFRVHPLDDGGARILSDMMNAGIAPLANALAQAADHVRSFFEVLRTELAFYVGCLNLHERLTSQGGPVSVRPPLPAGSRSYRFRGLYDPCLALQLDRRVVGNALAADGKSLVIITGANQGGKSTFLRSVGIAQLMMQCGMFAAAESFEAELCTGLFTHFKREEDATMTSGKLDEELARMSAIVTHAKPNALLLFNESFAATNEREGSEIATQIVGALLQRGIKVIFVSHLYEFAHGLFERGFPDTLFLRAGRRADGSRTFEIQAGEPLETSYGEDLYREILAPAREG